VIIARIALLLTVCVIAQAPAAYPERPIRYIVPSAAGGGPDTSARILADEVGRQIGRQIIVDNRTGATGTIGIALVAKAAPDGYTIGQGSVPPLVIMQHVMKLPYRPDKDLQPIVQTHFTPNLLAVAPSLPVYSVLELVTYAKNNPGKLLFASTGNASTIHLSGELFMLMTDTKMIHVPFKGAAAATTDLTAGRVHLMFDNIQSITPHVNAGRVRGLAVTSARRASAFPELPTIAEAGVPGYEVSAWGSVVAPAGLPKPILARLNTEFNTALASSPVKAKFAALGLEIVGGTPEQFAEHLRKESAKWADVVKRAGVRVE
jgi:tripartite-type tricarboxylate transporter receptor subunit TctC